MPVVAPYPWQTQFGSTRHSPDAGAQFSPSVTFARTLEAGDLFFAVTCDDAATIFADPLQPGANTVSHTGGGYLNMGGTSNRYAIMWWEYALGGETSWSGGHRFSGNNTWNIQWQVWRGTDGTGPNGYVTNSDNTTTDTHTGATITCPGSNAVNVMFMITAGDGGDPGGYTVTTLNGSAWDDYDTNDDGWAGAGMGLISVNAPTDGRVGYGIASMCNLFEQGSVTGPTIQWGYTNKWHGSIGFYLPWDGVTVPDPATRNNGSLLLASI